MGAQYAEQAVGRASVLRRHSRPYRAPAWRARLRAALLLTDFGAVMVTVVLSALVAGPALELGVFTVPPLVVGAAYGIGWTVALGATRSRSLRLVGAGLEQYRRVLAATAYFICGLGIASVVLDLSVSPVFIGLALVWGVALLLTARWLVRRVVVGMRARGELLVPTLLVGPRPQVAELLADLGKRSDAGYAATGVCLLGTEWAGSQTPDRVQLHAPAQLISAAVSGRYGAVMATDGLDGATVRDLAWELEDSPVELILLPRLADIAGPRLRVSDVEGLALVHVDLPQFSGWKLWCKRGFDIAFSAVALILLIPVLLVVALLVKLDDGGPVFFRQERIGRNGKPFTIHKFRTMCVDAEARIDELIQSCGGTALLFKLETDPRVTRLGAVLRRYSIDELPQFWSVLRGGMSVVGPRPQVSREVAEYTARHCRRLLIKPGITGLWQVSGRSELSMEESLRLDLRYVENWSILGDFAIILKTVRVVLLPRGAF